jgi:GNAT superfamily N-acetyltransferase
VKISVREADRADPVRLSEAFVGTPWDRIEIFRSHLGEHERGARIFLIGLADERIVGHGSLVWESGYQPFRDERIPEVQDLNVAPAFRRCGVGSAILDAAERLAAERAGRIGIGVGLHPGYGAAQRLYTLRGYVLDGRGVFRQGRFAGEGEVVPLDDDSVLHFTRTLQRDDPSGGVRVEKASPAFADWDGLHALLGASYAFMEGRIDPPSSVLRMDARALQTKAREEVLILAHDGERLVGCAFAGLRDDCVYVGKVAVHAGLRRRGIAARMIAEAEAIARAHARPFVELEARVELLENHATFSALGFVKVGESAHAGYDRPTSITMRKPVTR